MFTEKFYECLNHEGVVSIVSWANSSAHVVNTWNTYIETRNDNKLLIPVYGMQKTRVNIEANHKVKITLGSKEVAGLMGTGTGFLIEGTAKFLQSDEDVAKIKEKFSWANRVLEITVTSLKQTV